ncbi:helix-turn-helix transcriptional regulator [Lactobacillus sp. CC-MHH1034]|uniref:helix-turn-helix domain-containing protein n=1 Tax=Agrilactobacillus fermenti TaxID=2586909 RepID=UPI001E3E18C2|nr:helix-turn-helix transcriptional regulator [Agrilactobacillus fermenti]MCD2257388.1 helix-turn-helix transcriptional regulator [Agrilactobacillus fermenti]
MLGDKLKSLRKEKNATQEMVAQDLGLTRAQYSHFENNRNEPDNETLARLANYYNVTADYLLGVNQTPKDATSREVSDLKRILEQQPLTYEKTPVTDKDREAIQNILIGYFWNKGRHRVEHDNDND